MNDHFELDFYKHIYNTDVAIQVVSHRFDKASDSYELSVHWWNVVLKEPKPIYFDEIRIKASDAEKWLKIGDPRRYA